MSYEQTLCELNNLQKQFDRMEVNRRQKVNSIKYRRTQQLKAEYKIKVKDQHIENVKQRRASLDSMKSFEIKSNADRRERKRQCRLKLLASAGPNSLKCRSMSVNKRRENVFQRKQLIQQQKDQKKKEEYWQKQREREKRISRAMHRKKSVKALRPRSATTSFLQADKPKYHDENKMNRSFSAYIGQHTNCEASDSETSLDFLKRDNQKKIFRSKSAATFRSSSFIQEDNKENERQPLRQLNRSKSKRKRRKAKNFMKPTLSAYLCVNNPKNLISMAIY